MHSSIISRNGNYLGLLVANTVLGSAMPMLIILGGLAGLMLAPSTALATLPASLQTLAGLLAAAPFSLLMGRRGRKTGFVTRRFLRSRWCFAWSLGAIYWQFFSSVHRTSCIGRSTRMLPVL